MVTNINIHQLNSGRDKAIQSNIFGVDSARPVSNPLAQEDATL